MKPEVKELEGMLKACRKAVFFGGAGVSTASGIPDFRGADGIYQRKYGLRPEYMLSIDCLMDTPNQFFEFYRENLVHPGVMPNRAHYALAGLEQQGKLIGVITQNVDELHQLAGSKNVVELHGSVWHNYCMRCGKLYFGANVSLAAAGIDGRPEDYGLKPRPDGVPQCRCGGCVRPDVVLYGEELQKWQFNMAADMMREADLLIVGGTSLTVHPAASLVDYFNTERFPVVVINRDATPIDEGVALVIREPIDEVLAEVTGLQMRVNMDL